MWGMRGKIGGNWWWCLIWAKCLWLIRISSVESCWLLGLNVVHVRVSSDEDLRLGDSHQLAVQMLRCNNWQSMIISGGTAWRAVSRDLSTMSSLSGRTGRVLSLMTSWKHSNMWVCQGAGVSDHFLRRSRAAWYAARWILVNSLLILLGTLDWIDAGRW